MRRESGSFRLPPILFAMIETVSNEECTAALLRELRWGRQVKQSFEQIREADAAKEAQACRGHKGIDGLGKVVTVVPAYEYFLIREKYGPEAWHDKGFIRDHHRLEPSMKANNI